MPAEQLAPKGMQLPTPAIVRHNIATYEMVGDIMTDKPLSQQRRARLQDTLEKKVSAKSKWIIDKIFELADGVYLVDKHDNKEVKYYKRQPDLQALIYLVNRLLGSPTQKSEHVEETRGTLALEQIIHHLADRPRVLREAAAAEGALTKNADGASFTSGAPTHSDEPTVSPTT